MTNRMTQTILITGGSRGIGRAAAIMCGKRGWSVGVNYAGNELAAQETVALVEKAGGKAVAIRGDVSVEADVIAMFAATEKAFGTIAGVVNNAGIVAPGMALAEMSAERLARMFNVNVLGAYLVAREAARRMGTDRGGKGGSLVNLSSAAARLGSPNEYVDYAGSKGAIDTMTIGLSKELGPRGIRVNAIRPGLIDTEIHASGGAPDRAFRLATQVPLGRPGTADEVAAMILFLLGEEGSYLNGAIIDVTGGR
ncbi:NAD(P)-dependent dehydrogenase (short-subunit alcohol dehydrogenase family) [Dongia mobilis]|uniref:NAD(P)-dependent dehydrogenase (Short-subunit alcohol dehydrogenase family) n=1 Tax=Dongia mobilis TaxID=578943 RepID=A0A4R6WX17_9PROT|nr:SDR family oxidoreductase [Dongia mobilis]TDQ82105.1 NAD(P)-dependent dehydrogenase (short-subunit alcohol dehydrogenase family) [Dongia mobilis]